MASVLVDPDDISYMDDVDDDEEELSESGSDKKHKKRKNRIIHEAISINSNVPMVQELRQDRQRLLSENDDNRNEGKKSTANMINELCKDRKQALQEKRSSQSSMDKTDDNKQTVNKEDASIAEIKDQTAKREEIPDLETEEEFVSDTSKLLKSYSIDGKTDKGSTELSKIPKTKSEQDITYNDPSLSVNEEQIQEDLMKLKSAIQKYLPSKDEDADINTENVDKTDAAGNAIGAQVINDPEEVVKPKKISDAQILMIDEPSTSIASLEDYATSKSETTPRRESKNKRSNAKSSRQMGGIQIVVTGPQEDSERDSGKKPNGNVHGKNKSKSRTDQSEKSKTSTEISDEESSGLSGIVTLNYLRRLSEDGKSDGAASNDLLLKKALYEQSKVKPFKKMAKVKNGLFEVGIEGDAKRSYIKTITIMPDKKLVMFDRNNRCLKLYDIDFNPLDRVAMPVKFCGLAPVFDATLVVSIPEKKQLQFYHIDSNTIAFRKERTQSTSGEYFAIAHFENKLYMLHRVKRLDRFSDDKWSIHKVNLNMGTEEPVVLHKFCPGHKDNSICVNAEGVYMTNKREGDILLLDHDGAFKRRGRLDMSLPMSITSDGRGNMFVCGGAINSFIEVFKPDLQGSKVIFNKKAQDLVAMCFDRQTNNLYLSDKISGRIVMYKIEHNGFVHGLMRSIVSGSGISC